MENPGRESAKDNDLFFTCSLIDYIARKTKNTRADTVNALGKKNLAKIYDLADVYHCDNIERVSDDFIREAGIKMGNFDNEKKRKYNNNVTRFNNYVTFRPIDNTTAIGTRFFCFSNICGNHKI